MSKQILSNFVFSLIALTLSVITGCTPASKGLPEPIGPIHPETGHDIVIRVAVKDSDDISNKQAFSKFDLSEKQINEFREYSDNMILYPKLRAHPEGRGYALVIGINEDNYKMTKTLSKSKDEANQMKQILEASGYAVKILIDDEATKQNILGWVTFLGDISRIGDTMIIYYSGHGTTLKGRYTELGSYVRSEYSCKPFGNSTSKEEYSYLKEILYDFYVIPYQGSDPVEKLYSLVGSHELSRVLKKSKFSVKVVLLDACSAHGTIIHPPSPASVYHYELKRQGYLFSCMLKETIWEGEFSPLIFEGLEGSADSDTDRRIGNGDGFVSMFELINFVDNRWKAIYRRAGLVHQGITSTIYCAGDILLTVAQK